MNLAKLKKIIKNMSGKKVIVLGDLMVDEYIFGETSRISREAPVLILNYRKRHAGYGGAANAVANIHALNANPIPVGVVGDDENGRTLIEMFEKDRICTDGIIVDSTVMTTSKTRVMAGGMHTIRQQIVRIDREEQGEFDPAPIIDRLKDIIKMDVDGLLLSDYGCGVFSGSLVRHVNKLMASRKEKTAIDSRYGLHNFRNSDLAAPNEEEAGIGEGYGADDISAIEKKCEKLKTKIKSRALMVTRGSEGLSLFEDSKKPIHIPVYGAKAAVDTTGAGDTVVSSALLSLCAGGSFSDAAQISNRAGGLVVMKKGAATISPKELLSTLKQT